jgi:hypothetical protein
MRITYQIVDDNEGDKDYYFLIKSFLHENNTAEKNRYDANISKGQDMTIEIRVAKNQYYLSFLSADKKVLFEDPRIPPWAANWLTV